jgi:transcriptional regulator with XRE-family HTH domain
MRERRIMLGLTQTELARRIGVTCQQLHKYERGINRVAAGQLFKLAAALNVHLG